MKLTKKPKPEAETSRRRPTTDTERRPAAFSYHANRSGREDHTGRNEARDSAKKLPWWRHRNSVIALCLLFLFILLSLQSTSSPDVVITGNTVSRELLSSKATYEAAAAKELSSSPFNHIKYFTNRSAITSNLLKQFPELASATLNSSPISGRPRLTISAYQPAMILTGNGGSFVIDSDGIVRASSSQLSSSAANSLPNVTDQSGLPLVNGKAALPGTDVEFITELASGFTAVNLTPEQLVLPAASSELDVKLKGQPYVIKFALQGGADARQQLGTYIAIKGQLGATVPSSYVDVRVPERAYYK